MRTPTLCSLGLALFLLAGLNDAHAQQQLTRAAAADTIWIIVNHVKADHVEWFHSFLFDDLKPAVAAHKPEWLENIRILLPVGQNEDSTYTYLFMTDPKLYASYRMSLALVPMYGKEKSDEYIAKFYESLRDSRQISFFQIESGWEKNR